MVRGPPRPPVGLGDRSRDTVLGLAVALPAHYPNHFDTLGHLGLIYADTALFVVGALLALAGMRALRTT
jgi:hypothetical protein